MEIRSDPLTEDQKLACVAKLASQLFSDKHLSEIRKILGPNFDFKHSRVSQPAIGREEWIKEPLLILALEARNFEIAAEFVCKGASVFVESSVGRTVVSCAVNGVGSPETAKDGKFVDMFVRKGVSVNKPDKIGHTPLFYALFHKHVDDAAFLLQWCSDKYALQWIDGPFCYLGPKEQLKLANGAPGHFDLSYERRASAEKIVELDRKIVEHRVHMAGLSHKLQTISLRLNAIAQVKPSSEQVKGEEAKDVSTREEEAVLKETHAGVTEQLACVTKRLYELETELDKTTRRFKSQK